MPKTIEVAVITNAEGAHLDAYFSSLAKTEEVAGVTLADRAAKPKAGPGRRWARSSGEFTGTRGRC